MTATYVVSFCEHRPSVFSAAAVAAVAPTLVVCPRPGHHIGQAGQDSREKNVESATLACTRMKISTCSSRVRHGSGSLVTGARQTGHVGTARKVWRGRRSEYATARDGVSSQATLQNYWGTSCCAFQSSQHACAHKKGQTPRLESHAPIRSSI